MNKLQRDLLERYLIKVKDSLGITKCTLEEIKNCITVLNGEIIETTDISFDYEIDVFEQSFIFKINPNRFIKQQPYYKRNLLVKCLGELFLNSDYFKDYQQDQKIIQYDRIHDYKEILFFMRVFLMSKDSFLNFCGKHLNNNVYQVATISKELEIEDFLVVERMRELGVIR